MNVLYNLRKLSIAILSLFERNAIFLCPGEKLISLNEEAIFYDGPKILNFSFSYLSASAIKSKVISL